MNSWPVAPHVNIQLFQSSSKASAKVPENWATNKQENQ